VVYFDRPGGQNQFETMEDAVIREVLDKGIRAFIHPVKIDFQ